MIRKESKKICNWMPEKNPGKISKNEVGNAGLVFPSPNGTKYSVGVDDSGNIRTRSA